MQINILSDNSGRIFYFDALAFVRSYPECYAYFVTKLL